MAMIFNTIKFRDPITTAGGQSVITSLPSASAPSTTHVDKVQVVHAIPVHLAVSTNQQLYNLPLANTAYLCLRANPKRRGLTILNTNPLANLYIGYGGNYPINKSVPIMAGGNDVMDTESTPQDDVWVTADTANSVVLMLEFQNT